MTREMGRLRACFESALSDLGGLDALPEIDAAAAPTSMADVIPE